MSVAARLTTESHTLTHFPGLNPSAPTLVRESPLPSLLDSADDAATRWLAVRNNPTVTGGGLAFARKSQQLNAAKNEARQRVIDSLLPENWPGHLRILTMPGLYWTFESQVIRKRKRAAGKTYRERGHKMTSIYAVEWDTAIYAASLKYIPGITSGLQKLSEHSLRTKLVECFYCTPVEGFITDGLCPEVDAAWLDFTGQISLRRMYAIRDFWRRKVTWQLTVTALNGRWDRFTGRAIKAHGGLEPWLIQNLGGEVFDVHRYRDGYSSMLQITLRKGAAR